MGVLCLCLVLLFTALISLSFLQVLSYGKVKATAEATSVMEGLANLDYAGLLTYQPPSDKPLGPSEKLVVECLTNEGAAVALPANPGSLGQALPNPVSVRCTITWTDARGRVMSLQRTGLHYR